MFTGRCRGFKGQAQVVGAVLIFSLGIAMLTGVAFIFKSLKTKVVSDFQVRTADEVLEYVAIKAGRIQDLNATYATTTFPIPEKVGDERYRITAGGDGGLRLSTSSFTTNITIQAPISGSIDSSNGRAMIIYKDDMITMRGVAD